MLAERTAFSLPKMASEIRPPTTRSMMARASGLAATSSNLALGFPATATRSRMALITGWTAWWANSRASMKRSSGNLVGGALDHQHVLVVADIDQVEGGGEHLLDRGVDDELPVDLAHADGADRAVPGDVREGEGGAGAVDHRDVGLVASGRPTGAGR